MYIEKYWGNYIGGTDDSLNLIAYLGDKKKESLCLSEILSDLGLVKLKGDFRQTTVPLEFVISNGINIDFHFAIDLITDLAAIMLECKKNGGVNLHDLDEYGSSDFVVNITATSEEITLINEALKDFATNPLAYDLSELVPEDDMKELAKICKQLSRELE